MIKTIKEKAYVLGDNIDTDQIIPAEYLVYSLSDEAEAKKYGQFALSGVPAEKAGLPSGGIPFVNQGKDTSEFGIIIAGSNFGCGSSREHAPFALQKSGIKAIVAQSYARIFYRNSVDGGFLIPLESAENLTDKIATGDIVEIDMQNYQLTNLSDGKSYQLKPLGDVLPIVEAGGLFPFARQAGLI